MQNRNSAAHDLNQFVRNRLHDVGQVRFLQTTAAVSPPWYRRGTGSASASSRGHPNSCRHLPHRTHNRETPHCQPFVCTLCAPSAPTLGLAMSPTPQPAPLSSANVCTMKNADYHRHLHSIRLKTVHLQDKPEDIYNLNI